MIFKKNRSLNILKIAFDSFKANYKFEKARKWWVILNNEIPLRENAEKELKIEVYKSENKHLLQIYEMLTILARKVMLSYFVKWKSQLNKNNNSIKSQLLIRMIKLYNYHNKARCLNSWRNAIQSRKKWDIQKTIDHNECQNAFLIKSCKNSVTSLNSKLINSKSSATIKIFKISLAQDNKFIQSFFNKWRFRSKIKWKAIDILSSMFHSYQNRILSSSFLLYSKSIKDIRNQEVIEIRSKFLQNSIKSRKISTIFESFKQYTLWSKLIKASLSRIINKIELENLKVSFAIWIKTYRKSKEHNCKINKENKMSHSRANQEHKGNIENELLKVETGSNNLQNKLESQSHKILANNVWRLLMYSTKNAFELWAKNTRIIKNKQIWLTKLLNRLKHNYESSVSSAWKTWLLRAWLIDDNNKLQRKINEFKQLIISRDTNKYRGNDDINRGVKRKQLAYDENLKYISKSQTSQNLIIYKRSNKFYFYKLRLIFIEWREVVMKNKEAMQTISIISNRLAQRRALSEIKNAANLKLFIETRRIKLRKAIIKIYNNR